MSFNPSLDVPVLDHPPDKVGGPESTGLVGYTFFYTYPTGLSYKISFDEKTAYFTLPPGALAVDGRSFLGVPYRCRELRPDLFLAHWMVPGRQGHVALVFDLANNRVDCAALMPGLFEPFGRTSLSKIWRNGENAIQITEGQK
ncbi:uncharacterized protein A1O5_07720 [Cladophialophora psammophila CBS 110553]|uniref:Molybdenum cofactor biosynthesis protein F N-terminal domain-containing protein n=1 Tax=Cladophialophora psammophila CBS 110553 TaxID=1182543 RepID=W9XED5_9EURO|nr:uncharacterized protein A1O5_07720 [Cladophialophora psammophila CBS 110553]EXJ68789.1 hypothetical protein A1O5_07720 [Cladophialophora psammophila CBS 110553]